MFVNNGDRWKLLRGQRMYHRNSLNHPSPSGEGKGVGSIGVAQTCTPHPNPSLEGEGLISPTLGATFTCSHPQPKISACA
jgi:hypothetical protein